MGLLLFLSSDIFLEFTRFYRQANTTEKTGKKKKKKKKKKAAAAEDTQVNPYFPELIPNIDYP